MGDRGCPTDWIFQPDPRRVDSTLTRVQSWYLTRTTRNIVAVAARRSGKTVGTRARLLATAIGTPHSTVGYVGPTLKQAKRLIWRALMRDLRSPQADQFIAKKNESDLTIEFRNGSVLYVFGAERPEQIRGDGFSLLACDEADDPNYDATFFDEIVGPALSDQEGTLLQVGSPKGRGRLYREFRKGQLSTPIEERDPEYETIQVTAVQAGIISKAEIERARRTRPARAFAQEYEAHFNAPIGVIFEEWDDSLHVVRELPRQFDEVFACVDWGTAHRGVMYVIGVDRVHVPETPEYEADELARAWVLHEESHSGMGYDDGGWWDVARKIQRRWAPSVWYADPAGGQEGYLRQLRNALAGSSTPTRVVAADNEVRPGISAVNEFLHHDMSSGLGPRLLVHESCQHLRSRIPDYRWQPHPTVEDEFTDKPIKLNDDEADCLRYGVFSHFYRPSGRSKRTGHLEDRGA
jgi:hypothetical protein